MKLRVIVCVWTLLVLSVLTESKEECDVTCERESLSPITTTTTSINATPPQANCTLSVRNHTSESHSTVGLTPGTVYQLFIQCFNCCLNVAIKPEAVTSLMANATTSSILVEWTEPEGNWLHYTVIWSNGTSRKSATVKQTSKNITDLMAGTGYDINVTAVADDGVTEGESAHLLRYTKPAAVQNLTVMSTNTTEIHLNWVSPSSQVSQYKVEWHCGGSPLVTFSNSTSAVLSEMFPGTEYTVTVTAIAGDIRTEGEPTTILSFTNPEEVRNISVTAFTTSSVSLEWLKPEGNVSFYRVQWMNGSVDATLPVNNTYVTISQLTPGVQYTFTITSVSGDKETSGETKQQYTLPSVVRHLHITEVMTSSLTVRWTKPEGNADYYIIHCINAGEVIFTNLTRETSFSLEDLTAGSKYSISVAAAVDGLEKQGSGSTLTTFTRPGKPNNIELTERGTEYVRINWTLPEGRVDHYQVNISNTSTYKYIPTALLTGLNPGKMFDVTVTAVAGNFTNMSDPALVATSPTPPGSLLIGWRSNSSLQFNWTTPAMMEDVPDISYIITYQPEGGEVQTKNSTENNSELSSLLSGESYNVTIQTVGAQNLHSSAVHGLFFTLPNPVSNLAAHTGSTTSMSVTWSYPVGVRSYYQYSVQTFNATGNLLNSTTVSGNSADVSNLEPGSRYDFGVTTIAAPGSESTVKHTFSFTNPWSVSNITAIGSTTNLSVSWSLVPGLVSSYSVLLYKDEQLVKNKTDLSNLTSQTQFDGLTPGVDYCVMVTTTSETLQSNSSLVCNATFPNPPGFITVESQTTKSINFTWEFPEDMDYKQYKFTVSSLNVSSPTENNWFLLDNLQSGSPYTISVVTVGVREYESQDVTAENFTMPEPVRNLHMNYVNTTVVQLTWQKPKDSKPSYSYLVMALQHGVLVLNDTTEVQTYTLNSLQAGAPYCFQVFTEVGGVKSTLESIEGSTNPWSVSNITAIGSTTNLSVSWFLVPGLVSSYSVLLYKDEHLIKNKTDLSNLTSQTQFDGLTPGVDYCVMVTTTSGTLQSNSSLVCNATFPNPPGFITVESQTTKSINFTWEFPEDMDYKQYKITVSSLNVSSPTENNWFLLDNLQSGSPYTISVVTVGVREYESQDVTAENFTMPEPVRNLHMNYVNTTVVQLTWQKPKDSKPSYSYLVMALQHGVLVLNDTTEVQTYTLNSLQAGAPYCFQVFTEVGGVKSTLESIEGSTNPWSVSNITAIGSTTNLSVSWFLVPGLVSSYSVLLYKDEHLIKNKTDLSNLTSQTQFDGLTPGVDYCVMVTTTSGTLQSNSSLVCNATFPNPPGFITVESQTTKSINFTWEFPEDMDYKQYKITVSSLNVSSPTENNWFLLDNLQSGSPYTISVVTVGVREYESQDVTAENFTMPEPVRNLHMNYVNTTVVQLTWQKPKDSKPSYSYLVMALQHGVLVLNDTTEVQTYTLNSLQAGAPYCFQVFTEVGGVKSTLESIEGSTYPWPVSNITAIGSTTNLSVSWFLVPGLVSSYSVLLYKDKQLVKNKTDLSNLTSQTQFDGLTPGVDYCVMVTTTSGTLQSNNSLVCNATFPNPPGFITVESQTTKSINFTWEFPEDMDYKQYKFTVSSLNVSSPTENNWFLLDNLQSGSPYTISVVTVGVREYESQDVTAENFTRPYPVTHLQQTEITANTVTLTWDQPEPKQSYLYLVQFADDSTIVSSTNTTITELESGSKFSFTVTTQTADGTPADPVTVSYVTRPYAVSQLEAETLSATAMRLRWMKPLEYKSHYRYWVETTGCGFQYKNVTNETTEVSELLPGTNCTFCISVEAANIIKGEENCISQYTNPETVQPMLSNQNSNTSMLVMWSKPQGSVDYFMVYLNSSSTALNNSVNLSSDEIHRNSTSFLFNGLAPGRRYSAMLTTFSGPFNVSSAYIDNATYPNSPGPVQILAQTTTSIEVRWTEAPQMSDARYRLTHKPALGGNITTFTTTNTSHTFDFLSSGTSFDISVSTVGALDLESQPVFRNMISTRPLSVESLMMTAEERSVSVVWTKADDYKQSYRYSLSWQRSNEANGRNITINETEFRIADLNPGSSYNISVTTQTFDGTQAETRWISNCTRASPVTGLVCEGPNKAEAEVVLSWQQPSGQSSGFQILINGSDVSTSIDTCCNHTVSSLRHHTQYQVIVQTKSCGQPSKVVSRQCWTGITNPPIPPMYESKVTVIDVHSHNKFSLRINSSLLNNTNGPVTHVGVLVTDASLDESFDSRKYLGKTYNEWKAESTPAYLATVAETGSVAQSRSIHDLSIEIGTGDSWNGYYNGALKASQKYHCAVVLFTDLILKEDLVDSKKSLVSITTFAFTASTTVDPVFIGWSVGASLGIFCILFTIIIGFVIYWKRHNKESSDIEIHSLRDKVSMPVRVEDYEAYFRKQKADSNCGFAEEYEELKLVGTAQSKTHALTLENKSKNRYNNVLPYDSSRVKLSIISGSPNDDYINANYMPGFNSRMEFIAAQGPLPTTVNAFWRMIWEKNVQTVVMLTHCNEQGRIKCEQYWSHGTKHFGDIIVTTTSEIPLEDWTIRDFTVKNVKTAETRSICHFHFTAWPDHGVPEATELLISFRHLVREHMNQYSRHSPTVVHCSAGVGRTGTFIAVDHVIFQIERENIVDVYGIVYNLRMHRSLMVQTEDQYVFLNQCALDIIRSRTGTNVDLIYQNIAALSIYENIQPKYISSKGRRLDA